MVIPGTGIDAESITGRHDRYAAGRAELIKCRSVSEWARTPAKSVSRTPTEATHQHGQLTRRGAQIHTVSVRRQSLTVRSSKVKVKAD